MLPLFFFAGAASAVWSYRSDSVWGTWLFRRAQRLYRPVFYYLAFWCAVLLLARTALPAGQYDPIAGLSIQLLWFLGVYVVVLACVPGILRLRSPRSLAWFLAGAYLLALAVDAVRLNGGPGWIGSVNFLVVWLIPAGMGVAYAKGWIGRPQAALLAVCALAVNLVLLRVGYEVSLVTTPGQKLSNMTPPSALLAGHCLALCGLAVVAMPLIRRLVANARLWWFVAVGNSGAMTLYLWHLPVLLAVIALGHALGADRSSPDAPLFWWVLFGELVVTYVGVAVVFTAMYRFENVPIPWWDARPAARTGARVLGVGALVVVAGVANLLAARWGLRGPGVGCVAVMLAALVGARALAGADSRAIDAASVQPITTRDASTRE